MVVTRRSNVSRSGDILDTIRHATSCSRLTVSQYLSIVSRNHPYPEWFPKKLGLAKRRTTWFDLLLKSDIDKNENHILVPSTMAIVKKLKAITQKDEFTIADLKGAGLERLKKQYQNDVELEYHVGQIKVAVLTEANTKEKYATSITKHYAARYHIQGIEDMILDRWSKETHRYIFEALNGIHHWEVRRSDDKEYKFSYVDLSRLSLNDVEDMYLLQLKDKLHHLLLEFGKDFNNALLLWKTRRTG
ncbi:hypothetical protein Tco_1130489 [Tanacetum coccineum]